MLRAIRIDNATRSLHTECPLYAADFVIGTGSLSSQTVCADTPVTLEISTWLRALRACHHARTRNLGVNPSRQIALQGCPALASPASTPATDRVTVGYTLFADVDPQHRGLLNLATPGGTRTAVLGPQAAMQTFTVGAAADAGPLAQFLTYVREGVWHIWIGFDHILFLLSLLLPAVGTWQKQPAGQVRWQPVQRLRDAVWDVLRIVTAFTVAHSITLSLATLGLVSLPSRLVESVIAASVVLAALNNVWPLFQGRRWSVAFAFGLIHGFGFASVLADLGLPQDALALALVGFNVGVELGQLAIVVAFLPLAFVLRDSAFYRRAVLVAGSLLIAAIALAWFLERAFQIPVFPA